jgi:hypothetical protein
MCGQWRSPYAVAMQDGAPFALAGIWENWKERASGDVRRTPVMLADAGWTVSRPAPEWMATGRFRGFRLASEMTRKPSRRCDFLFYCIL